MPKYQITAPDGRIVVVEGTKPPTEQDAAAIFAQIGSQKTQEPEQSPYSPMEQVKYTLRAAGEAAPFGMGDLTAGYVATQARNVADVTHGKDLKTRLEGAKRFIDYATPIGQIKMLKEGTFGKERADFIKEQEDFAKHHGGLNFLGEFVGGALTGGVGAAKNVIGKQGIKALMGAGAREGGKFGLYYGAGSGFTQDTDKLSIYDALKGAGAGLVGGAVVGGALPPVAMVAGKALGAGVKGAKAIGGKIAKILKKDAAEANQALGNAGYLATDLAPENKVFLNLLEANPEGTMEAVKAGEPLVAHANRKQLRRTRGAVTADEGADQTFIEAKRAFDQGKIQKGEDISDRLLSKESGYTATERIADEAHSKYQPLYEEVMKAGEIELPQEIIANETILGAIQEAQGRAGYTRLKGNNVRVLDKAKRVLQDKFKSLQRAGKNDEAREYQIAKEELVNFMDRKLPQYAEARKAFMEGQELQEFVDLGRKLKNISHAEVERIAKTLTPEQQQALKAGIGDSVRESLYNTRSEGANVLDKAFPAPLRRKMQALGIKDEEIANEIAKEIQTNANYQFIGGGSNTMNKAYDAESVGKLGPIVRTIKAIKSPLTTLEKAADKLDNKLAGLDSEEIARLMFDPKALAEEAQKPQHQRKIAEILRKSKQSESGQSLSGYLGGKLKEKGGYAMKTLGQSGLDGDGLKAKQLEIIKKTNPMHDDYHVGIREIKDIKTFAETLNDPESFVYPDFSKEQAQKALQDGKITIYSSKPIKNGNFVSTSRMMAQDYAGHSGKVYSKEVPLDNVAWISGDEGQYAKVLGKKPIKQILNSEGNPVATTEEGTKNFGKFFKGSKVVDENGNPLVVYHGTINKFSEFSKDHIGTNTKNKGIFGNGFYFTDDPKLASNYIREGGKVVKGEKGNLMPAYLSLKKPFLWNSKNIELAKKLGFPKGRVKNNQLLPLVEEKQILKFTENLKKNGYDGVIYQYKDGTKELVAFNPTQIKSVKNSGKFNPKDPNIYKSLIGGLGISQILKNKESK